MARSTAVEASFRLDLRRQRGRHRQPGQPAPPGNLRALQEGAELLLDDGKIRLRVERCGKDFAETTCGQRRGAVRPQGRRYRAPALVLPLSAMTEKDRRDLEFGLTLGVDWIALSFVQRPEDILEIKDIVKDRAGIVAKLEKPAAIQSLEAIVAAADAVMVARGDLGVEMPAELVPSLQSRSCGPAARPASR